MALISDRLVSDLISSGGGSWSAQRAHEIAEQALGKCFAVRQEMGASQVETICCLCIENRLSLPYRVRSQKFCSGRESLLSAKRRPWQAGTSALPRPRKPR